MTATTTTPTTPTDSPTNNVQHHPITSAAELAPGNSNRYGPAHTHAVSDCCTLYPLSRNTRLAYIDKYRFSLRREIENATPPGISITASTLLPKYLCACMIYYYVNDIFPDPYSQQTHIHIHNLTTMQAVQNIYILYRA